MTLLFGFVLAIISKEITSSCTEPRHDQQYYCGVQNAFTAVVDAVRGPTGDPFDRNYRVTVKKVFKGSDVLPNTTITIAGRSHSCGPTILELHREYSLYERRTIQYSERTETIMKDAEKLSGNVRQFLSLIYLYISKSLPRSSANRNGPRLEVVNHEEIPPAYVERLKLYDCTCQIEIQRSSNPSFVNYEDGPDKCVIATFGRDCQFKNGFCKRTNNLCSWEIVPSALQTTNCVENV